MQKKYILISISVVAIVVSALFLTTRKKIGYIDMGIILSKYEKAIIAKNEITKTLQPLQKKLDEIIVSIKYFQNEYQKEKDNKTKLKIIEEKFKKENKDLNILQEQMKQYTAQLENKYLAPILIELDSYLKKYGEKYNYYIIWSATENHNIVYAKKSANITEKFLNYIEKNDKKEEKPVPTEKVEQTNK